MAKHRSSQEWKELLSAYQHWKGSQAQFCVEHNISIASFYYHRRKQVQTPNELPAVIELPQSERIQLQPCIEQPLASCQLECKHPGIGLMKVHCQVDQLAMVVDQLTQDSK